MAQIPQIAEVQGAAEAGEGNDAIARLRARIDRFAAPGNAGGDLRLVATRLFELVSPLRSGLVGSSLPLPRALFTEARAAVDTEIAAAQLCLRLLQELRSPYLHGFRGNDELMACGLELLGDAFELCCVAGISAPQGFWSAAHGLYLKAREEHGEAAQAAYRRLLGLATIQPESFTSAELVDVFAMLRDFPEQGELTGGSGEPPGQGWFWIDFAQDSGPIAVVRRAPPPVDDLAFFSAAPLARAATERLGSLASGEAAAQPLEAGAGEVPDGALELLLRRLRERWAMPPRRTQPRRRSEYSVQACAGLENIWEMFAQGEAASAPLLEWTVQNESPGGFAIMRVAGVGGDLIAGMAIALRRESVAGWAICVVRWIRSERPEQVELGLQLVSQAAIPVRVAFRAGISAKAPVQALVLPPLAAVRRHQAVLAPAGTYAARRFMLIHESERLYVAQGRLLSLDMQTEAVELFQFEVDPYPI